MTKMIRIHTRGQLAVGVAIAFIGVVSMFAFVFNTTMNVREKMAMQQTSDYAALVASNTQRYALNQIRQMNQAIDILWFKSLVLQQPDHCYQSPPGVFGSSLRNGPMLNAGAEEAYSSVAKTVTRLTTSPLIQHASGTTIISTDCETACVEYNKAVNKKIRADYSNRRQALAKQIHNLIMNTNDRGFQLALRQFLTPSGLPWNLQQKLKQELGAGFNIQNIISLYNQGRFNFAQNNDEWGYEIVTENAQDPIFIADDEARLFTYPKYIWTYQNVNNKTWCQRTLKIPFANQNKSLVKIIKTTDFQPHFFTGINYLPPENPYEKNEHFTRKQINAENFGKAETRGEDIYMFQRKSMVGVRSAAKPFGGTFPTGLPAPSLSSISNLVEGNAEVPNSFKISAGKEFEGSKLFGIADSAEIGGYHLFRADIEATQQSSDGNTQNVWRILKEDYLH